MCGKTSLQDAKSQLPLLIFEYYQETTKSYRYTWFLVLEILVIIIAISAFLAIFTVLFLRKKRTSLISETLLRAQEQERARFSYELHDSVVQDIKAEQLFVQMLASCVTKNQKSEELLYKIDLLEKKILSNLRNIIKNLSLPQFEKIPLENLITEYCAETAFINDIECPVYIASAVLLEKLSPDKKLHVFRIIQESISNAIKHGGATEIGVLIREDFEQRTLLIFVTDDGVGFDTTQTFSQNHFGLRAMKSRASFIKAKLTIESEKGDGTMVKLVLQG